jgi:microcystin-dependent protein
MAREQQSLFQLVPPGLIFLYAGREAPSSYLICDGASYSTDAYPDLFDVIGYKFGSYFGQFRVPDMRGRFVRGWNSDRPVGSTEDDTIKAHGHLVTTDGGYTNFLSRSRELLRVLAAGSTNDDVFLLGARRDNIKLFPEIDEGTGDSFGDESRPKNVSLHYIIKHRFGSG